MPIAGWRWGCGGWGTWQRPQRPSPPPPVNFLSKIWTCTKTKTNRNSAEIARENSNCSTSSIPKRVKEERPFAQPFSILNVWYPLVKMSFVFGKLWKPVVLQTFLPFCEWNTLRDFWFSLYHQLGFKWKWSIMCLKCLNFEHTSPSQSERTPKGRMCESHFKLTDFSALLEAVFCIQQKCADQIFFNWM